MKRFPFPDRISARDELMRDVLYSKIPQADRDRICDDAWRMGASAARTLLAKHPDCDIDEIAKQDGLEIIRKGIDRVSAGYRVFGEYFPKKNCIYMYLLSIRFFAEKNDLTNGEAEKLIFAHEYFHFLEENRIGRASGLYIIPRIHLGSLKIGSSGIAALSEIGAHGFARTYWETYQLICQRKEEAP